MQCRTLSSQHPGGGGYHEAHFTDEAVEAQHGQWEARGSTSDLNAGKSDPRACGLSLDVVAADSINKGHLPESEVHVKGWGKAQHSRPCAALAENLGSASSTHIRWLTTACKFISRGSESSSRLPEPLHSPAPIHTHTHN